VSVRTPSESSMKAAARRARGHGDISMQEDSGNARLE
jgi:hypothetical protein